MLSTTEKIIFVLPLNQMSRCKKNKKSVKVALPTLVVKKIKDNSINKPFNSFEIETCYGIIWDVLNQFGNGKVVDLKAPLSSTSLNVKYGNNYTYYLKFLKSIGVLYSNGQYSENNARRYQIPSYLFNKSFTTELIDSKDNKLGRYIFSNRKKYNIESKRCDDVSKALKSKINKLNFNTVEALKYLESIKDELNEQQYSYYFHSISKVSNENKYLRCSKRNNTNNRFDSVLTSLPSILRQFIVSDSLLYNIDLKNSQPVIFNIILDYILNTIIYNNRNSNTLSLCLEKYIDNTTKTSIYKGFKQHQKRVQLEEEINRYKHHTSNGKWYEHLSDIYNEYYGIDSLGREDMKSKWMAIAYSSNSSKDYREDKIPFEQSYPMISKLIRILKKANYKSFSIMLQKIESEIFIDNITKELLENNIVPITVHDSMIVSESEVSKVKDIMEAQLIKYLGFKPVLDVERLIDVKLKKKPLKATKNINKGMLLLDGILFNYLREKTEQEKAYSIEYNNYIDLIALDLHDDELEMRWLNDKANEYEFALSLVA
jgi:hypothetical protein